jgi:hypothetical protein
MTASLASAIDESILAREIAEAELERVLSVLAAVMATLASQAEGPTNKKIHDNARALLAEHGRDPLREWRDAQVEAWGKRAPK